MKTTSNSAVFLTSAVLFAFTGFAGGQVWADFPDKPIRLVVMFPPGGSNDVLSRFLGMRLTDRMGQQIIIDNRGGANGLIATELVANAAPDGYTLLFVSTSWAMNAALDRVPFDIEKAFDPIGTLGISPNSIVVNPNWGVNDVKELVSRAKANPGSIFYGSSGTGGFNHFGGELFKKITGINLVHVPYKGGNPAMVDVASGQIPMMFSSILQALPLVRQGRLKFIAVGSEKRSPVLPDVPTVAESGYPGYAVSVWWGIAAPHGIPPAEMATLEKEIGAVLADPQTHKRLLADAAEPLSKSPAEFRAMISQEIRRWRGVAKDAGIVVK